MKIIINESQLNLLSNLVILTKEKGFQYNNLIHESIKEYKVTVFFIGWHSEIRVGASNSSSALAIARLMFPKAIVTGSIILNKNVLKKNQRNFLSIF